MLIENSQALRNWLQTCLGKFSDADPVALSKYVVALVKKDKETNEMYNFLLDQLDIFLHNGTKEFVDLLFEQLRSKEYLQGVESNDVSSTTCPKIKRKSMLSPAQRKLIEQKIADSKIKEQLIRAGSLLVKSNNDIEKNTKKDSGENLKRAFKRCKDYDEKGYCVQGEMCEFDHGNDPVVVEDVKFSILNFNVKASDNSTTVSSTVIPEDLTSDVPHHFPLCTPLPPLPNSTSMQFLPPPPPPPPPLPPPPLPLPPLPKTDYVPEAYNPEAPGMCVNPDQYSLAFYPSYNTPMYSKEPRNRELVGVTIEAPETSTNKVSENIATKRKLPVYSRLGPNPKKRNLYEHSQERKNTLLLRKVPPALNNILAINQHFSKYGTVTNIEVCFENSSESALVKFQYPFEAAAAFRSTEAVMNNRFIKVFYYTAPNTYKSPQNLVERDSDLVREESESSKNENSVEVLSHAQKAKLTEKPNNFSSRSNALSTRTVFNASSFVLNKNDSTLKNHAFKDDKKVALSKRLALHKKMGAFLQVEIDHEKSILSELSKTKNPKKKMFLKTALKGLQSTISKLQNDFKQSTDDLRKYLSASRLSKTETQKELLDADLDLYKGENSGSNTAALKLKVDELKAKARALGLLPNGSPKFCLNDKVSNNPVVSPFKKDNCVLFVSGLKDKETLKKHFLQFGGVEKIEDCKLGSLVCFFSRKAAEKAIANGKQIGDTNLSISWYETQKTREETSGSATGEDKDEIPIFVDDDDEEEEEDKESRSWRH